MAAPSYTEDLTDIDLAETTTGYLQKNYAGGGGGSLGTGADFAMQGTLCVDRQVSNNERGIMFDNSTAITFGADDHLFTWGFLATPGLSDTLANRGAYVIIGTGTTATVQYHVEGSETFGALARVAKCYCVDVNYNANTGGIPYRTVEGSPSGNPRYFGYGVNTTGTVKGANIGLDAQRYGTGAYLTAGELVSAGDGSDDPCTFAGFQAQNDSVSNRWGILTGAGGANYELQGRFVIGQNNSQVATLARFRDSNAAIVFVDTVHAASDFTQIILDHASTRVEWTNINITALGAINRGRLVVNSANPTFNYTGGQITDIGITTLRSNSTCDGVTWRGCGEVTANGATLENSSIFHGAYMIDAQDETSYGDSPTSEGTFSGGTGHAASDVLLLDDGTRITVDAVSGGVVTQFTVDTLLSKVFTGVRTQVSSSGSGVDFTLTPDTDNFTESSGLIWDTAADPNGELDNMEFDSLTPPMGHAIEFGLTSPLTMTLTGIDFGTNFSNTADGSVGNETFWFRRTTGEINLNLVNCSGNFGYKTDGATVNINAAIPTSVANVSEGTPITVIAAESVGSVTEGDVILQGFADSTGEVSGSHNDEGTLQVTVRARNQGVATACIAEDGGVFTDETSEGSSNTTSDMTLTPVSPAVNDAYYFGHQEGDWNRLKLDISAGNDGTGALAWEYWNGAWVALSGVVDGTNGFANEDQNIVSWTLPGDWATTTINSQGPLYYVRARVTTAAGDNAVGRKVQLDTTRYLPYAADREIETGVGLADNATWTVDTISKFDPDD